VLAGLSDAELRALLLSIALSEDDDAALLSRMAGALEAHTQ
jgi:hypothetical protein